MVKFKKFPNATDFPKPDDNFNLNEVRHLAGNFAINCLKGYDKSFDEWYNNVSGDWRKIANQKPPKK